MGEPAWAIATLFPEQGSWTEDDYLRLSAERGGVELCDGFVEVLPVPNDLHQRLVGALFACVLAYSARAGGVARVTGLRLRLAPARIRMPGVLYLSAANLGRRGDEYWTGADLVIEVLSPGTDDQVRDRVRKRAEYAAGGVREYWLVDPRDETITALRLDGDRYVEHGVFRRGERGVSATLDGLAVDVDAVFDAP